MSMKKLSPLFVPLAVLLLMILPACSSHDANPCTNNRSDHKPSLDNRSTLNPSPGPDRGSSRAADSGPDNGPNAGSYLTVRAHTDSQGGSQLLRRRPRYRRSHQLRLAA